MAVWLNAVPGLTLGGDGEFTFLPTLSPTFSFFIFSMRAVVRVYMCGTRPIQLLILTFKFRSPFRINYLACALKRTSM